MLDLIARLNASGLIVNNMFQLEGGVWRINFRREERPSDYAEGATLEEAVRKACATAIKELKHDASALDLTGLEI